VNDRQLTRCLNEKEYRPKQLVLEYSRRFWVLMTDQRSHPKETDPSPETLSRAGELGLDILKMDHDLKHCSIQLVLTENSASFLRTPCGKLGYQAAQRKLEKNGVLWKISSGRKTSLKQFHPLRPNIDLRNQHTRIGRVIHVCLKDGHTRRLGKFRVVDNHSHRSAM
jgi:hypothetical protein